MRHSTRRGIAAASVFTIAALALAACSGSGDSGDGDGGGGEDFEPLTSVKLQLQWLPQAQFAGYYVAQDQGYFEEEGFDNVEIILAWVFTGLTLLYMLPWAVAATRRSTNSILIAVATFFLAWTGVGWLVLLVLSFLGPTVHTVRTTSYVALPPAPPAGAWAHCAGDPPNVRRWWDGHAWTGHIQTF